MFSEENIERTKERVVEYVVDNADKFEWKNVYSEGEYSGYWNIPLEQVSSQPIHNAVQVFGIDSTIDIIVETLEKFYNIHNNGESKEPVSLKFSNLKDFLVDVDDDEDYYDDYDEDDYGYDEDYFDYYDSDGDDDDEDDIPLSKFIKEEWEDLSDFVKEDIMADIDLEFENENKEVSDKEMVNHPPHYNQGKFETIDIIEDIVMGYDDPVVAYLVGTTLKYLARAPFKNAEKQDLEKAEFYLKRAIDKLTNNSNSK